MRKRKYRTFKSKESARKWFSYVHMHHIRHRHNRPYYIRNKKYIPKR